MFTKMNQIIDEVNAEVAEREELTECIAICLIARKNLFILLTQSSETRMIPVFTIVEDWAAEDDYGHSTEVYFDYDLARKNLCKKILGEKQDGCIKQCDETELVEDYGNDYYEVHEEGFYSDKHYLVSIQKHDVPMNVSDMVKYINN